MLNKLGGRKVVFGVLLIIVGVAIELLSTRGLTDTMSMFLVIIGGAYFLSNALVHGAKAKATTGPSIESIEDLETKLAFISDQITDIATPPEMDEIKKQLETVKKQNGVVVAGVQELVTYVNQASVR